MKLSLHIPSRDERRLRRLEAEKAMKLERINEQASELVAQGWGPLSAASCVTHDPGYVVGTRSVTYKTEDFTSFRSRNASQWSTVGFTLPSRQSIKDIVKVSPTAVIFDKKAFEKQVNRVTQKVRDPKTTLRHAKIVHDQRTRAKQVIRDSALFL